ncbi:hypothetical protein ABMA28_010722 [Loxostege sticticalis]|uniref:MULE transposase domain-containing protein n=1 Tax=Loxostege sticticalis TaxID=481309 RepID=A0ABD0S964_LOXSC
MSDCELVKSKRGKNILFHEGYCYHLNRSRDSKFYWRCSERDTSRCNVFITTSLTNNTHSILSKNHEHAHLPDPEKYIQLKLKANIKEKANHSMDTPAQIIQKCIQEVPSSSAPHMPNKDAMRMLVHRVRNKDFPTIPTDIRHIVIPNELAEIGSEQFLLGHYTENDECVIVFATNKNIRLLNAADYWLMDGTFRCCPHPFCQIYSIHAMVGTQEGTHKIVPLVYGLLSHKTEKCYTIFLQILKRQALNRLNMCLNPRIIMTDFERAAMRAIKKVFPSGLVTRYNKDPSFAHKMRHFGAMAFLEPTEIVDAFDIIKDEIIPEEAKRVTTWFGDYYVNGSTRISKHVSSKMTLKQRPPMFPPHMWSVHDSQMSHVPLSQNALESWHNRWNTLLGRRKWNIFRTITEFKKEQQNTDFIIECINSSQPMPKRKRLQSAYKERITQHLSKKSEMDTKTYLSGLAHICHLIK